MGDTVLRMLAAVGRLLVGVICVGRACQLEQGNELRLLYVSVALLLFASASDGCRCAATTPTEAKP